MSVKIRAELVAAHDLKPGDLFSAAGSSYWDTALDKDSIGERVFIRTHADYRLAPDPDNVVYRITIERGDE